MVIKQPNLWILFVALLGTFVAYLSTLFPKDRIGADVFLWTVIILHASALFEINQKTKDYSPEEKEDIKEVFVELSIPNGQIQYKIGLWAFAIVTAITYISLYIEKV